MGTMKPCGKARRPISARQGPGCVLTENQAAVLAWIDRYVGEHCYPPAIRDVDREFGFSINGAVSYLVALQRKGFLRRGGEARARAIVITRRLDGDRFLIAGVWHQVRFIPADRLEQEWQNAG